LDEVSEVTLLDGRVVSLRRLDAKDVDAVIALHDTLTDHERYLRFFTTHPAQLKALVDKLTERGSKQYALGAFDSDRLIGVASYVLCDAPGCAEVAVAVAHEDHLRGVATAVLRQLALIARGNGVHTFVADVLAENLVMRRILSDLGWHHARGGDGSVICIEMDLTDASGEGCSWLGDQRWTRYLNVEP
jgi:RimJ/RimL family protein N-acetyltransferase